MAEGYCRARAERSRWRDPGEAASMSRALSPRKKRHKDNDGSGSARRRCGDKPGRE